MGFPVPTVAPDLQTVLDGPRPVATPRRLPASAPVSVCIYKISDSAGDIWDSFQGQDIPLWHRILEFHGHHHLQKTFTRFLIAPTGQRTTEAVDLSTIAANECRGLSFALFFNFL